RELHQAVRRMVASENRLLELKKTLHAFDDAALDLALPDERTRQDFADVVEIKDVAERPAEPAAAWPAVALERRSRLRPGTSSRVERSRMGLFGPLLADVASFRHVKFNIVKGAFAAGGDASWEGEVTFDALGRTTAGPWRQISVSSTVRWDRSDAGGRGG